MKLFSCCVFDWYIKHPAAHTYAITFAFQSNMAHISLTLTRSIFFSLCERYEYCSACAQFGWNILWKFLTHIHWKRMENLNRQFWFIWSLSHVRAVQVCGGEWTGVWYTQYEMLIFTYASDFFCRFAAELEWVVRGLKNFISHNRNKKHHQNEPRFDRLNQKSSRMHKRRPNDDDDEKRKQQRQQENFFANICVHEKLLTTLQIFIRCARALAFIGACLWLSISRHVWIWILNRSHIRLHIHINFHIEPTLSASGFSFILASINFVTLLSI